MFFWIEARSRYPSASRLSSTNGWITNGRRRKKPWSVCAGRRSLSTNKVKLREAELSALPELKFIAITATGFDNVDVAFCRKQGIGVANVPGYARQSVPEHVLLLILALRRNLPAYLKAVRDGRWQESLQPTVNDIPVEDLHGTTLGLIGYGDLAKGVERLARAFGMEILIAERKGVAALRPGRIILSRCSPALGRHQSAYAS